MARCNNKRERILARKMKLKKLYHETISMYGAGAYYDEKKDRLIRYSCNSSSLRRSLNRIVRRKLNQGKYREIPYLSDGQYRKIVDYWWTLL